MLTIHQIGESCLTNFALLSFHPVIMVIPSGLYFGSLRRAAGLTPRPGACSFVVYFMHHNVQASDVN